MSNLLRYCIRVNKAHSRCFSKFSKNNQRLPVLTLYTKDPCPLCDIAKEKISVLQKRYQFETVDITEAGNESWWNEYKYDIPVFHFEGKFLMKHKANLEVLETAIQRFEENSSN